MKFPTLTSATGTADAMITMHLDCRLILLASKLHLCLSLTSQRVLLGPQTGGQQQLAYSFYSDAARTQLWGCRGAGCTADAPELQFDVAPLGTVSADIPLYGRVIGAANLPNGDYSSTIATTDSEIYRTGNYSSQKLACAALGNDALDTTQQFTVSATINAPCVVLADSIDFGAQTLQAEVKKYGRVRVTCPANTSYAIKLGPGNNGTQTNRLLKSSKGDTLNYALRDPACNTIWGDGTSGTTTIGGTGNGSETPYTVCAILPAQTQKAVGTYSDTVLVTVTY